MYENIDFQDVENNTLFSIWDFILEILTPY